MTAATTEQVAPIEGKPWIQRRRAYIAYALILFNVYGSILSFGPYLEYYYTNQKYGTDGVSQAAAIIAARLLCLCVAPLPIAREFLRGYWRGSIYLSSGFIVACHLVPHWLPYWYLQLLVGGVVHGLALGALTTAGLLVLGTHYKNNIPLVSMIGSAAGFIGALVYTGVAYQFLPNFKDDLASYANTAITVLTLAPACYLPKQMKHYKTVNLFKTDVKTPPRPPSSFKSKPALLSLLGIWLISFGTFVWPTYLILQLSNAPALVFATEATRQLFVMYSLAIPSSIIATLPWLRYRLGPVNAFICAAAMVGICYFNPAWMPFQVIAWFHSPAYGICLGVMMALYFKVVYTVTMFDRPKGSPLCHFDVGVALGGVGLAAAAGVLVMGLLADFVEAGLRWGMTVTGGVMMVGAACLLWGRLEGTGRKFYYAV